MKTIKNYIWMAAIALTAAALGSCSNDDFAVEESPLQQNKVLTLVATLSPQNESQTRSTMTDNGTKIITAWEVGDKLWVAYQDTGDNWCYAKGTVSAVDGDGKATITVDLVNPKDGTNISFNYPYDQYAGVKDVKIDQLGTLDDAINNHAIVWGRGTLSVSGSDVTLPTSVPMSQEMCIWKLNFTDGGNDITNKITSLNISFGASNNYMITPNAQSNIYVALYPEDGKDITITAATATKTYSFSKAGVTLVSGKVYRSTVPLTEAEPSGKYRVYEYRKVYTDYDIPVGATTITSGSTTWTPGTYVVSSDVTITGDVTLTGDVNLILKDGKTLTVNGCIFGGKDGGYPSNEFSLNIYGQEMSSGRLVINSGSSFDYVGQDLIIHGGVITATNATQAIETNGELTIYHGTLNATGSMNGICAMGTKTNFIGGMVNATSTGNGAAIDLPVDGSTLTISGGTVNATGTAHNISAKGIEVQTGNLVISGGTVVAKGGDTEKSNCGANAIDVGGSFTMDGNANVTATGGAGYQYGSYYHGGIGLKVGGAATISSGKLTATSGGGGNYDNYPAIQIGGTLTISGSTTEISATCGRNSKGIYAKNISISGGTVFAQGGDSGDSSNGGNGIEVEENGTITVNGGKITAVGGVCNALGGDPMMGLTYEGGSGIKGTLKVYGGMITASGGGGNGSSGYGVYWGSYGASEITLGSGITLYCNYSPNPTGNAVYGPTTTTCVYRYVIIK